MTLVNMDRDCVTILENIVLSVTKSVTNTKVQSNDMSKHQNAI